MHDFFERHAHHIRHFFAVVLADDDVGNAPFAHGAVLGRHIAQPRPEHALRSLREDLRIQQDEGGGGVVERGFDVVDLHGGGVGGKAVHGRRGADDAALAARSVGEDFAQIVDHARADAENEIAGGVEVHHHRAKLPLRGSNAVVPAGDDVALERHACLAKHFFHARARGADRLSSFGDFISLSDVCDVPTARLIAKEVSDGVIAPGYEPEALEILKGKRKGNYNVIQIDESYVPAALERKMCYGVTFEQGRNALELNESLLANIVTENKELPAEAKRDLLIALIALKYTQSNSVCYVSGGQTIGVGAGQQSRIHCTRLAGNKADLWQLRHHPKVLALQFNPALSRSERDNTIDLYLSNEESGDVLGDDVWQNFFTVRPEPLTPDEKKSFLANVSGVSLGSDAFFPFGDNIERARRSGVSYVAQPGGSIRDDNVIATCDKYGMVMAFTGLRLFHH